MTDEELVLQLRGDLARLRAERDADQEQLYVLETEVARMRERLRGIAAENDSLRSLLDSDHFAGPGRMCVRPRMAPKHLGLLSNHAFLAMPFSPPWAPAVERAVTLALRQSGMLCRRGDQLSGRDVMGEIWASICECGLVVADVTGGNANVLYELGLADAIGKSSLLICQAADAQRLPFDLLGQRLVVYSAEDRDEDGELGKLAAALGKAIRNPDPAQPREAKRHG